MHYPPLWKSHMPLGVVAPASAPHNPDDLKQGLDTLVKDGYKIHWDPKCLTQQHYLSGSDIQRAAQFNQALGYSQHFIATRGGYGCLRILDQIDYDTAKNNSGILIGFSDITALQLSLYTHAGWKGISGPLVVEWNQITEDMKADLQKLLKGEIPQPIKGLKTHRDGSCSGTMLGGNLSTIVRMIGSKYLPCLDGKLLFIEDINEPPYRIDALFTQMKHAKILDQLGGLIIGGFTDRSSVDDPQQRLILEETIRRCVSNYSWPVVTHLSYGHFLPRRVLPTGVEATLTASSRGGILEIMEPLTQ